MFKKLLPLLLLVCLVASSAAFARNPRGAVGFPGSGGGPTPPFPGFVLKFDDEFTSFNGNATGSVGWKTQYNFGRTNNAPFEAECYMDSSVGVNPFSINPNGLQIQTALALTATPCGNLTAYPYTSGIITSYNSFFMQYGYFEARVLMPAGAGFWPAFWLLSHNGGFPPEIDMMESLGNDTTVAYANIHYGTSGSPQQTGPVGETITDASVNYHTFAVDFEPVDTIFYYDTVPVASYPTDVTTKAPMYMLLNLAVGASGSWPGPPNGMTVFPSNYQVKWVRAWASPNSINIGGSQVIP